MALGLFDPVPGEPGTDSSFSHHDRRADSSTLAETYHFVVSLLNICCQNEVETRRLQLAASAMFSAARLKSVPKRLYQRGPGAAHGLELLIQGLVLI